MISVKDVKHAKRLKIYQEGIKCIYIMFMFVKLLKCFINFMGPFPPFYGYTYILVLIDYVSKWVEVVATRVDEAKTVVKHIKSLILYRYEYQEQSSMIGGLIFVIEL